MCLRDFCNCAEHIAVRYYYPVCGLFRTSASLCIESLWRELSKTAQTKGVIRGNTPYGLIMRYFLL